MTKSLACILLSVAACSSSGGGTPTPDAAPVNAMVKVSGVATEIGVSGRTPVQGVAIEVVKEGETTPTAMTTSAADGTYSLMFATGGTAVNGYLHAKNGTNSTTYVESYLYPAAPISADLPNITVFVLTSGTLNAAGSLAGASQQAGNGFIAAEVLDPASATVAGAAITVSPTPGSINYNGSNGFPAHSDTVKVTAADGIGYAFDVPPGAVTIGATKSGSTFHSHMITARPDVVTLTLIQ